MGVSLSTLCHHKVIKFITNFRDKDMAKDTMRVEMEEEEIAMEEEDSEEEEMVDKVDQHVLTMGRVHYLVNSLLQVQTENEGEIVKADEIVLEDDLEFDEEMKGEEFEQGEISKDFREEEYDGFHLEMRLLLSRDKRERDVSEKNLRMRDHYILRGDHLFIRDKRGPPRRVICDRNRQIDVIAALHDGPVGGHKDFVTTIKKVTELYFLEGMYGMIRKYCKSCVHCQIRSPIRYKEPPHPRYMKDVGAVIHLDLLAMILGLESYNYIFDVQDNLTGFVDGKVIRTKTGAVLTECIKEYYLRYPLVVEFTMDRGSEFTCREVKELLDDLGVIAKYTTRVHPQANAPVERRHSTITNLLAKWTVGKPTLWPKFLRTVFFVENITVTKTTGYAPATLWEDCEWFHEGEAEVADKLEKMEEGKRRELEIPIQKLQDRIREKTELLTQGVASHVPEILKEIQRLRAREEKKDMQWTRMEKEVESLKAEIEKTKIERGKLEVKVEALSTTLDNKSKEVETGKMKRKRLEREDGKLEAKVSEQGKVIESEKSERK
ncbi:hypothetical protein CBR_g47951 [Chara braunii]|uniref:Integrase catalytic domain-containing protein n=1 Tax=Chara braunii TaxID=69332 RepID=A0A388M1Q1_CHABU|nr:hypothetical protein CBR_g47951 [Chara braunii]|eukprot:GBG88481.1 hypothetical protein CBR_g47951 [Chara braunii]